MPNPTILIVDDDPDFRAIVQSWLEDAEYQVYSASNGLDGLLVFAEIQPQLTITDIRMPGMDGFELISRIREISDAHVLALTALGDTENTIRGLELGVDEYLRKPVVKRELLARVSSLLRRAELPS